MGLAKTVSRLANEFEILTNRMENLESELEMSEISSDELFNLAIESFSVIWNNPVNDHWDEFLRKSD